MAISNLVKQTGFWLAATGTWVVRAVLWGSRKAEQGAWDHLVLAYWWFSVRVALLVVLPFLVAAHHWNWSRLQVDGRLTDRLLQDVLAERRAQASTAAASPWSTLADGRRVLRCFVPVGAGATGLAPFLNEPSQASARAWIEPTLSWLSGDWWVVDIVNQRIIKMSRMDKDVLQPHARMKDVQCVPVQAIKLINAGKNVQGRQEFQVVDLSDSPGL